MSVDNQLKIVLDEVFSEKNDLVGNIKSDTLFVINNEQELRDVSKNINTVINVDFDKQSIVWGKIFVSSISDVIRAKDIYMCIQSSGYKYEVSIEKCINCWTATGYLYFWEIYPQKIDTKNISLIIKELYN
jgi:RNA binding exosome subunit